MSEAASSIQPASRYLTKNRLCFLLCCLIASVLSMAILIYRSKLVQAFDLILVRLANSDQITTTESVNHKAQFIAILDNFTWIHLMCALTGALDITSDYYLVKHLLIASISLSLTLELLFLAVARVTLLTPDQLYWTAIDVMFAQIVLFTIFLFNILISSSLYNPLMKQLAASTYSHKGQTSGFTNTTAAAGSSASPLTEKMVDAETNQKDANDKPAGRDHETTIAVD